MAVTIVDYGLGNTGSLVNIFKRINVNALLSSDEKSILDATHLILPGVGAFDTGMKNLVDLNVINALNYAVNINKVPILGICLGAQLMMESSSEGVLPGLGWIRGQCVKFDESSNHKIPHMGWNTVTAKGDFVLFKKMPYEPPRFYFVHSYHFSLADDENITATTTYGREFVSAFRKGNVFGVQFHPEKSHKFGMQVLSNFSQV